MLGCSVNLEQFVLKLQNELQPCIQTILNETSLKVYRDTLNFNIYYIESNTINGSISTVNETDMITSLVI